jgi:DNA-binding MarR family transcriptional regulator
VRLTTAGQRLTDEAIGARLTAANAQLEMLSAQERRAVSDGLRKVFAAVGSSET